MNYNCIIVDDDPASIKVIEQLVQQNQQLTLIGNAKDAMEAMAYLQNNQVDIVLLDIEMPGMSGLDFINTLMEKPEIILITSQKDYAIDAFDYEVTDYLLKPVSFQRFLKAINRATSNITQRTQSETNNHQQESSSTIFVKEKNQFSRLERDEILFVEAFGDYVNIYTSNQKYTIHSTMKNMEKKLDDNNFMRVHRSYIVNLGKIETFDETLVFIQRNMIPIGGSFKDKLIKRLNLF